MSYMKDQVEDQETIVQKERSDVTHVIHEGPGRQRNHRSEGKI